MTGSIPARIREIATERADALFCVFLASGQAHEITFAELYAASVSYAREYQRRGINAGDIVIIMLHHTPELFFSFVGAMLAGAIPSFMPFPSPKQDAKKFWRDHATLFERVGPALIVSYATNIADARVAIPDFSVPTMIAPDGLVASADLSGSLPGLSAEPSDVACLQHSSGTTGLKKGVMLTHAAIIAQVEAYATRLAFGQADSIVSWLPLYHDMGFIACFMMSLIRGTRLIALDPFEWVIRPPMLLDAIVRYRPTFCWQPNFAFTHLVNTTKRQAEYDLSSIRAFINCSEPCKPASFERFSARFAACGVWATQLQVCYAMAENVFAVTQTSVGFPARKLSVDPESFASDKIAYPAGGLKKELLSCGPPIEGVRLRVCDDLGVDVAPGKVGQIFISSPFIFTGYYRQPDVTASRLRDGWYATGDRGFIDGGELFVTGRVDDMIIVNGRNYYAHELEDIVNEITGVIPGRNVAIAVDDTRTDATAVIVMAERAEGADIDALAAEIRREIFDRSGLALHSVVLLDAGSLSKTTSGKISRSENKKMYDERRYHGAVTQA